MRNELIEIQEIDRYLSGRMSEDEVKVFEDKLANDAKLQNSLNIQRNVMEVAENMSLRNTIQNSYKRFQNNSNY